MIDSTRVLRRKDDVRYRIVGDEGVAIRQSAAEVLALNDVGARMLELIDSEISLGALMDAMLDEYDVDREELSRDVERFVAQMNEAGLVEEVSP